MSDDDFSLTYYYCEQGTDDCPGYRLHAIDVHYLEHGAPYEASICEDINIEKTIH